LLAGANLLGLNSHSTCISDDNPKLPKPIKEGLQNLITRK